MPFPRRQQNLCPSPTSYETNTLRQGDHHCGEGWPRGGGAGKRECGGEREREEEEEEEEEGEEGELGEEAE